jgi:hypothetical protein
MGKGLKRKNPRCHRRGFFRGRVCTFAIAVQPDYIIIEED